MLESIFLVFAGLCAGGVVAAGLAGLSIGLSIIPRYAGVTHTGEKIFWYEGATMLGAFWGNLYYLFVWRLPFGSVGLGLYGLFTGMYLGSWILALAEIADIFPLLARRLRLEKGMVWIIASVALGKWLGSWLYFYKGF